MAALTEPKHGYAIMSLVEETTNGDITIGPASLYTIIKKLLEKEWIELHTQTDTRKKVYTLTKKGRNVLIEDIVRRKAMIDLAEKGLSRDE